MLGSNGFSSGHRVFRATDRPFLFGAHLDEGLGGVEYYSIFVRGRGQGGVMGGGGGGGGGFWRIGMRTVWRVGSRG